MEFSSKGFYPFGAGWLRAGNLSLLWCSIRIEEIDAALFVGLPG